MPLPDLPTYGEASLWVATIAIGLLCAAPIAVPVLSALLNKSSDLLSRLRSRYAR